jgi:hypothetical protein
MTKEEKETKRSEHNKFENQVNYVIGLGSIVFSFINPLLGFILGLIGLIISKDESSELATKSRKFSKIGLILSIIIFIIIIIVFYFYSQFLSEQNPFM